MLGKDIVPDLNQSNLAHLCPCCNRNRNSYTAVCPPKQSPQALPLKHWERLYLDGRSFTTQAFAFLHTCEISSAFMLTRGWSLSVSSDLSSTFKLFPTQHHASRCDNTCTLANGLWKGRAHTKSGNSHALITCYLSHVLITAQSTDGPEPQACQAHARQNHKLIILVKIPRTSTMLPAGGSFSPLNLWPTHTNWGLLTN